MTSRFYTLLTLAALSLFLMACQPASAPRIVSSNNRPAGMNRPGQPVAPTPVSTVEIGNLGWKLSKGARQTLADYQGKVVVLDFWATYCPPCLEEIPHLVALQEKHQKEGLNIIGLNVGGDEDRPLVPDFVKKLKIQYDLGEPEQDLVETLFNGTDVIPQTFVFDRKGKLVRNFSGYGSDVRDEMDKAVQQALAN